MASTSTCSRAGTTSCKGMASSPPWRIMFFGWGEAATSCLEVLFKEFPGRFQVCIVSHENQDEQNRLDTKLKTLVQQEQELVQVLDSQQEDLQEVVSDEDVKGGHNKAAPKLEEPSSSQGTPELHCGTSSPELSRDSVSCSTSATEGISSAVPSRNDSTKVEGKGKQELVPTARSAGLQHSCHLFADSVKPDAFLAELDFQPHLMISVSYRRRIDCLHLAPYRVNFHPSLLPKHRGCFSGFWTIFDGDVETGVTCHHMEEKFDRGTIVAVEKLALDQTETSKSLYRSLLPVTQACFRKVVKMFFFGHDQGGREQQGHHEATPSENHQATSSSGTTISTTKLPSTNSTSSPSSGPQTNNSYSCVPGTLPKGSAQEGEPSYHSRKLPHGGVIQPGWEQAKVERFIRAMRFPPHEGAIYFAKDGSRVVCDALEDWRKGCSIMG
ncbi:unnamed protein product [Amoebophrya sp. A25]|nr:unnamed protein product [Amoebophrya sp. A25]|eukprot:GSA25T00014936001.1